jgi:hypothetical protein
MRHNLQNQTEWSVKASIEKEKRTAIVSHYDADTVNPMSARAGLLKLPKSEVCEFSRISGSQISETKHFVKFSNAYPQGVKVICWIEGFRSKMLFNHKIGVAVSDILPDGCILRLEGLGSPLLYELDICWFAHDSGPNPITTGICEINKEGSFSGEWSSHVTFHDSWGDDKFKNRPCVFHAIATVQLNQPFSFDVLAKDVHKSGMNILVKTSESKESYTIGVAYIAFEDWFVRMRNSSNYHHDCVQ